MRHGSWGGLLIVTVHQAFVAVVLAFDTYVFGQSQTVPVPGQMIWPIVFAAAVGGAVSVYANGYRSHVDLAQALMLLAYGSRAMGVILGGIFDKWTTQTSLSAAGWAALMLLTQRAWTEARGAL